MKFVAKWRNISITLKPNPPNPAAFVPPVQANYPTQIEAPHQIKIIKNNSKEYFIPCIIALKHNLKLLSLSLFSLYLLPNK